MERTVVRECMAKMVCMTCEQTSSHARSYCRWPDSWTLCKQKTVFIPWPGFSKSSVTCCLRVVCSLNDFYFTGFEKKDAQLSLNLWNQYLATYASIRGTNDLFRWDYNLGEAHKFWWSTRKKTVLIKSFGMRWCSLSKKSYIEMQRKDPHDLEQFSQKDPLDLE